MSDTTDTIVAEASAKGRAGVSVIRISGPLVSPIMLTVLGKSLEPRKVSYSNFYASDQSVIDRGIALYFSKPNSFTGEDVLELQGHGGRQVVDLLIEHILTLGTRIARPGEFSERAFLNGKIDLTQAEAIADLIDASSKEAARSAMRSLQGEFSREIINLNESIIQLRIYIEAAIDFSEEEIDFLSDHALLKSHEEILLNLQAIQAKATQGSLLREGLTIVISGKPNVGKSTLLNFLSGKDLAIVSETPGTTRDILRDVILLDDMPINIFDTAGIRESEDLVEQEGIRRALLEMQKADLVMYLVAADEVLKINELPKEILGYPILLIRNKIDLSDEMPAIIKNAESTVISLSAKTGAGIDLLKQYLKEFAGFSNETEGVFLARRRHLEALQQAKSYLEESQQQLLQKYADLSAESLKKAHKALGEMTGEFTTEDLLGHIFANFCVGK